MCGVKKPASIEAALLAAAMTGRLRRFFLRTDVKDFVRGEDSDAGYEADQPTLKRMIDYEWLAVPRTVAPGEETGGWKITEAGIAAYERYLRNPRRSMQARRDGPETWHCSVNLI